LSGCNTDPESRSISAKVGLQEKPVMRSVIPAAHDRTPKTHALEGLFVTCANAACQRSTPFTFAAQF
jgi:hypothetical protein